MARPTSMDRLNHWAVLAALLAAAFPGAGGRASPSDVSALIQLDVVPPSAHPENLHGLKNKGPWQSDMVFRLVERQRHFVGSASFMLHWMDELVHFYDVALYLNSSSWLWGRRELLHSPGEHVEHMLDDGHFSIILRSTMASRSPWQPLWMRWNCLPSCATPAT